MKKDKAKTLHIIFFVDSTKTRSFALSLSWFKFFVFAAVVGSAIVAYTLVQRKHLFDTVETQRTYIFDLKSSLLAALNARADQESKTTQAEDLSPESVQKAVKASSTSLENVKSETATQPKHQASQSALAALSISNLRFNPLNRRETSRFNL